MGRRHVTRFLAAFCTMAVSYAAAASDYLTVVVPFAPGASADVTTRLVAQQVAEKTGRNIVIENRPGGNGIIAADFVKRASNDGRTLLLANIGTNAMNQALYEEISYSADDFAPVATLWRFPSILVVPASSPAQSVADLVAIANDSAKGLNFGSAGSGSGGHILGEMLRLASGANMVHVPYRGLAPALIDLMASRLDFMFSSYASVEKQIEAGQLRALAVASDERLPALPNVPTLKELDPKHDIVLQQWFGLAAPAGTDANTIAQLHEAFTTAVQTPDIQETFTRQGLEAYVISPEEFRELIAADTERLGKIVAAVGAKAD